MTKREKLLEKQISDLKKRNKTLEKTNESLTKDKVLRSQAITELKEMKTSLSILRREVAEKHGVNELRRTIYKLEQKIWG